MNNSDGAPTMSSLDPQNMELTSHGNIAYMYSSFVLLNVCLAANIFMIASVCKSPTLFKRSSTKLTLNLLVSGSGFCLVSSAGGVVLIIKKTIDESYNTPPHILKFWDPLIIGTGVAYLHASAVLSVTRLLAMTWPSTYKKWIGSESHARWIIIATWIYTALIALSAFFGALTTIDPTGYQSIEPMNETSTEKQIRLAYKYICMIPMLIPCACYAAMWFKLFISTRSCGNQTADRKRHIISQWQSGVTRALFASVITSFFCGGFYILVRILRDRFSIPHIVCVSNCLYLVQFLMDPILLFIFAKDYHDAVNQLCNQIIRPLSMACCKRCSRNRVDEGPANYNRQDTLDCQVA